MGLTGRSHKKKRSKENPLKNSKFKTRLTTNKIQMNKIAIIGLGYVGLPLARLFATKFPVVGFDINQKRIEELNEGRDVTLEVEDALLKQVLVDSNPFKGHTSGLFCMAHLEEIREANYYIVTVPTL